MTSSDLGDMVAPLVQATKSGHLDWEVLDEGDLQFSATAGAVQLILASMDRDNQRPYYLAAGRPGQPLDTMEQVRQQWTGEGFEPEILAQLWELARRSAFDMDNVLSDLQTFLAETNDVQPF